MLGSKTFDSRSGQKTSILPKSLQSKSPLPTSVVTKQFGRLSWLSSGPQQQEVLGKAEMHLVLRTLRADFTVWMPDWGTIPLTTGPRRKVTEGGRCHKCHPDQRGTK